MKALAIADPLLDLDRVRNHLDRGWESYQMVELALVAIDAVALRMDVGSGADQEEVEAVVAEFAAVQQPERPSGEHREVAQWIIHRLINPERRDRGFDYTVGAVEEDRYERHRFSFQLLSDRQDGGGRAVLAASDAAINVLVHALDVDIASEQVAAEAKLQVLLKKGDIPRARRAAQEANFKSRRYQEDVLGKLKAARRDVRSVDWETEIEPVLNDAQSHLSDRIQAERELLGLVRELQERPLEADQLQGLDDLKDLLVRCEKGHLELSTFIASVGEEIRTELIRQVFVAPSEYQCLDVNSQLFEPVLGLTIDQARQPLTRFLQRVAGPVRPTPFYLPDVLTRLSEIPNVEEGEPVAVEPVGWGSVERPPPMFTDEQEAAVTAIIASCPDEGWRLSDLIDRLRSESATNGLPRDTDALLGLRAMQLFAKPGSMTVVDEPEAIIIAVVDGQVLDDPVFGGDDLLLRCIRANAVVPRQATGETTQEEREWN